MKDVAVEFIKPKFSETRLISRSSNAFKVAREGIKTLPVGGFEGRKIITPIVNPRYREGRKNVSRINKFVSKEYKLGNKAGVEEIIYIYDFLRKKEYPVPGTTRYYEEEDKIYLLMTDMTEGGKYRMWGYSDNMAIEQQKDLFLMDLTRRNLRTIKKKARDLANKATNDGMSLLDHFFHVRKSLETGEIDIVLLDVDGEVLKPPRKSNYGEFDNFNDLHAQRFFDKLVMTIIKAKKYLFI